MVLTIVGISGVTPVMAKEYKGQPEKHKIGDKLPLPTGEAVEYKGESNGKSVWSVKYGEPVYIPSTSIEYDCQWYDLGNGKYMSGDNIFQAFVSKEKVTINYDGKSSHWQPSLTVGIKEYKLKKVEPVLLNVDPINENYINNTLMWDYGGGVKRYLRLIEGMVIEYYTIDNQLDGDLNIKSNISKDAEFNWHRPAYAYDANNKVVDITESINHDIYISKSALTTNSKNDELQYPIIIDPDTSFTTLSYDTYWEYVEYDYVSMDYAFSVAHDASSAYNYYILDTMAVATGASHNGASTAFSGTVRRAAVMFDTSGLPDDVTVTVAELNLYGTSAPTTLVGAWTLQVQSGMPTYPHIPPTDSDYNYSYYAGSGGTLSSGSMGTGYKTIVLNATGRGWVNKTGYTKFMLREQTYDIGDTTPPYTYDWTSSEWIFYSYEKGAGYRPYLEVTYSATEPSITADDASNVGEASARLNATVTDDGGESCSVRWGYGTTNQTEGNFTNYDTVTSWTDAEWDTGEHPYLDVDSLNSDDKYYYRIQIDNDYGTVTSGEINFTTESSFSEPSNFRAFPSATSIALSWAKGNGTTDTLIRWSTDTYPTTTSTGTELYENSGTTTTHSGVTPGLTYYYSAWGESSGNYTAEYATVAVTTMALNIASDDLETPVAFSGWFQEPDYTNLSGLEPIYSAVNGVADSLGTPRNTAWQGLLLVITAVIAIAVMAKAGLIAGLVVSSALISVGCGMGILSTWFLLFIILFGIVGWSMKTKEVG